MNVKSVSLISMGLLATTGAALSYYFLDFSKPIEINNSKSEIAFNPEGKTAGTRYPTLRVPEYRVRSDGNTYDNSFWLEKARKLVS